MPAENRVRVAVIGAGRWGPNVIRCLAESPRCDLRVVADHTRERLEQVGVRYPGVRLAPHAREAFEDPCVDAVVITTPASSHYDLVMQALDHGKHVLVEKPLTHSVTTAERLCERAQGSGLIVMVGHTFLYNEGIRRVKEFLVDGRLGAVYWVAMTRTNRGPIRSDVDAAWDLAAHDISIANYWLGKPPVGVTATGGSWVEPGIADAVFITMDYGDGILVNLRCSWLHPTKTREVTIVGAKQTLTYDDLNLIEPIRLYDSAMEVPAVDDFVDSYQAFSSSGRDGEVTIPPVRLEEPLRAECDHFLECVISGSRPRTSAIEGLEVVRVLDAVTRSVAGGGRPATMHA